MHRFHSYKFPDGTEVKGIIRLEVQEKLTENAFKDIDFKNKSVLDVGCWDGFYSIKAREKGANWVLGIDVDPWNSKDWMRNFDEAVQKFGFDPVTINCRYDNLFDLEWERKDIVLFMGVLYHLIDPFGALYKMREVTKEVLILETLIDCNDISFPCLKFYPGKEMNNDPTNWFGPNKLWVESALKVVGFNDVKVVYEYGNRAVFHAR